MKRFTVCMMCLGPILMFTFTAQAGNCYSDSVVRRWVEESNQAAESVLQQWAQGRPPQDFAPAVAVILANEFYIFSHCREQADFVKSHVYIVNTGNNPKVETVPAVILERALGYDILSPRAQVRPEAGKGIKK